MHATKALCLLALTAGGVGLSASVTAQTQRSGGGGEAAKIMQQYQQLASERTALQAENARLKKDVDAAKAETAAIKKERDQLKTGAGSAGAALAQAKTSRETSEKNLEQSRTRFQELVGRYRELADNLRTVETDRSKVRAELAQRERAFDSCAENNQQLLEINTEILDRYEHVGAFTRVSASEPFTRITRTRIENLVDETRERALQLRVQKRAKAAETQAATPAAAPAATATP